VGEDSAPAHGTGSPGSSAARGWIGLGIGAAGWIAVSVLAFLRLDPILAAFVVIFGLTLLVIGFLARDWDRHSTFEEREMVRARKRKEKWQRGEAARERDRVRWAAHQAKKSGQ
jgi:hypothetical protein